tara:strand:+ start:456 stop:923 length:468 start_codon:yes stop_codon:yes gene_type:complete
LDDTSIYEVFRTKVKDEIISDLDSKLIAWTGLLKDLVDAVSGGKYSNPTAAKVSMNRFPNETSVKSLIHLGLLNQQGNFVNMASNKPCFFYCAAEPILPLNEITIPTALINGAEDPLADTTDVNWLATQLKNVVWREIVPNAGHGLPQLNDMAYF